VTRIIRVFMVAQVGAPGGEAPEPARRGLAAAL
jgi:hypothetical protein